MITHTRDFLATTNIEGYLMNIICPRCKDHLTVDNAVPNGFSKLGWQKFKSHCRECYNAIQTEKRHEKTKEIAAKLSAYQPLSIPTSKALKNLQIVYTFDMPEGVYSTLHRKDLLDMFEDFIRHKLEVPSSYIVKCINNYAGEYFSHITHDPALLESIKTSLPQIHIRFTHE
jgi:uncharacterized protein YqcC (DUF446 family)